MDPFVSFLREVFSKTKNGIVPTVLQVDAWRRHTRGVEIAELRLALNRWTDPDPPAPWELARDAIRLRRMNAVRNYAREQTRRLVAQATQRPAEPWDASKSSWQLVLEHENG